MGPMTAGAGFADRLVAQDKARQVARVDVALFGSLALTGKGHATDAAVILGLQGNRPSTLDPDDALRQLAGIREKGVLSLGGSVPIAFVEATDLRFLQRERLPFHSNAMRFTAFGGGGDVLETRCYYSVGGGTVLDEDQALSNAPTKSPWDVPYNFRSGSELLELARNTSCSIAQLMRTNELAHLSPEGFDRQLSAIRQAMSECIDRGMATSGTLPGGLMVKRRAPLILQQLVSRQDSGLVDPLAAIDWVNLWALAVNEENAAGGKVVTAPTNGASGIVPAVLRFYERFTPIPTAEGAEEFLLTAAAIGSLFKENASISGAEVGCQGEVGVACSMAAAGLAAALGASPEQVENAAEIGIEHNLGLTCDPVAALVQVPCIERNAVGSIKAIEAARLAMLGDGTHRVTLDQAIETMRKTGLDMNERYKETSLGGLAVNVVEC